MKLNLKQLLAVTDLPKPSYDSRRRRNLYGFLHDSLSTDPHIAEYENSRAQWGFEHALAIKCIDHAVEALGMTWEAADKLVANNFGLLIEAVRDGTIDPDPRSPGDSLNHFMIGAVVNVVGRGHYAGTFAWFRDQVLRDTVRVDLDGEHPDSAVVGVQMVDATTIYRRLKQRLIDGSEDA